MPNDSSVAQDDLAAILRALGLGDHARPESPHEVVRSEVLPRIQAWRVALEWFEKAAEKVMSLPVTPEHEESHREMEERLRPFDDGDPSPPEPGTWEPTAQEWQTVASEANEALNAMEADPCADIPDAPEPGPYVPPVGARLRGGRKVPFHLYLTTPDDPAGRPVGVVYHSPELARYFVEAVNRELEMADVRRRLDADPDWLKHAECRHPDYEYATTTGQRKAWNDADRPPPGEGWERNFWHGRRDGTPSEGWERFDFHEESYWMRPAPAAEGDGGG